MRRVAVGMCGVVLVLCVLACGGGAPRPAVKNPMSLNEFSARGIKEPTTFLLECRLHRASKMGGKDCWMVMISDPETHHCIYGHVEQDTETGERIFAIIKDGKGHMLSIAIRHSDAPGEKHVIVADFNR